ncbi:MAG: hypothetical protein DRP80_03305 [Candidatus Omnitrophota bacterium]|nr:MAG: hypothetical protein DRP69_01940 [Candidatus Omnitrophota bacterium]RKY44119.1 MAG: hypothetical protein DRP80_03305 [Candidatus Omnitrophota bacterium]
MNAQTSKLKSLRLIIFITYYLGFTSFCSAEEDLSSVEKRGEGKVQLIKYSNGHWQLLLEGSPYLIKGITYEPVKVGDRLDFSNKWMSYDFNNNGINDTAYESWVDENKNNRRDRNEKVIGDFQLLKEMGINTIRIYHPVNINKELLRDLYNRFGIRVIMGNFLGAYCRGSGASWRKGTDYTNPQHLENMINDVRKMVLEFKDEPYILVWLLGNENDVSGNYENSTFNNTNARFYPGEFAKFVNEVARLIHSLDPEHPVGICNATTSFLKYYAQYAPELDFVGFNAYLGPFGFDSLYRTVKFDFDRPVLITEYGVDAYNQKKKCEDEFLQLIYHRGCWRSIERNSFGARGVGNAIGGIIHTWLDPWWQCGSERIHDKRRGAWQGSSPDGWFNDEWLGICSQGNGRNSPYLRQLRKVYFFYQREWRQR